MRPALLIAWHDIRHQLRQPQTLIWLFLMPPIFFYFIGTVTSGFSSVGGGEPAPVALTAEGDPGFLQPQLERSLRASGFAPHVAESAIAHGRTLAIPDAFTDRLLAGEETVLSYRTDASELSRELEEVRVTKAALTLLADVIAVRAATEGEITAADFDALNAVERSLRLDVGPAGARREIPSGFQQSVPGMLVMFTLLVLLTSGASLILIERKQGLLRRLASAPLTREQLVFGKWLSRMALATIQVGFAMLAGTLLFAMDWGPDLAMIGAVLFGWAAFCASAGLLLGNLAATEGQATGIGVLASNLLAALGGCWWPIEITPAWMQGVQKVLPTGWAMDALHKLISFEAGWAAALPHLAALVIGATLLGWAAARRFRYD